MRRNIGWLDRIIRLLIAAKLYSFGFTKTNGMQYLALLGVAFFITALIGVSPVYLLLKITTRNNNW